MGNNWDKFVLLSWKNWLLHIRFPIQSLLEVVLPLLFTVLLVLLRSLIDPEAHPTMLYAPFDLEAQSGTGNFSRLGYSPCGNDAVRTVMENAITTFPEMSAQCYDNGSALEVALWSDMNQTLAGVQFGDDLSGRHDLDRELNVIIRFPSELRNSSSGLIENWATNLIYPVFQVAGPREPDENNGAAPNYHKEGFLRLQYHISKEIIKYHTNDPSVQLPHVHMQRFPYSEWHSDPLLEAMQALLGLFIMISFANVFINTVKVITLEKEKQLKEAMKIMGLSNWLHWTAWFVKTFVLILIVVILMVVLLKATWFSDAGHSVFTLTDPFLLFFFLIIYGCATITFAFLLSAFFTKANVATTAAGIVWFLTYFVYLLIQNQTGTNTIASRMLACLALNAGMSYGFHVMLLWEGSGRTLGWAEIFTPVSPDDSFTLGHVIIMLIVDVILYLLLALYVEGVFPGEFGVPLPWYYPFTRSYWCGREAQEVTNQNRDLSSDVYEKEPTNLRVGVQIDNLTKIYSAQKVAVNDLSFNMFEGQITVLLGHNGAGKTTTMSMLTGMITPTSGTALVSGYDIRKDMAKVRDSLGLCPQHNILFDDLTVAEHLYFYSKLKGMTKKEAEMEVDNYVRYLDLVPKREARSKTLSGGMKRKLSVAVALCGNSKVCMLDEPTAGMDPAARRALWDMINQLKKDRTILLTTHFMDEADVLGDRIAIMAGGKLQCCGSSFFLKKRYGAGYHLVMDKSKDCDVNQVTGLLHKYIPQLKVETNIGSELTYILAENQSGVFEAMLSDLESNSYQLGINSYGISLTTMEEVFMKVGADYDMQSLEHPEENGHGDQSGTELIPHSETTLTGFALWKNQFMAMILKKACVTYRTWYMTLLQNVIPVAILILTLVTLNLTSTEEELPSLDLSLGAFVDPITVVTSDQADDPFMSRFIDLLRRERREVTYWDSGSMTVNMYNRTKEDAGLVRMRYIIGASFHDGSLTAWFNNEPYHSPAISLEYSMNAILQGMLNNTGYKLEFFNQPLPFNTETRLDQISFGTTGYQIALNLGLSLAFVTSFFILFYVKERVSKSKHLQLVSGMRATTFWLTAAVWDFVLFQITCVLMIVTIVVFNEEGFNTAADMGRVYVVLLFFILPVLPMTYLASFLFDVPSTGYSRLSILKILTGPIIVTVVQVLSIPAIELTAVADGFHYAFSIFPHYSASAALVAMSNKQSLIKLCDQINEFGIPACFVTERCCDLNENYFDLHDGAGLNLIYMAAMAVILTATLFMVEYRVFHGLWYKIRRRSAVGAPISEEADDSDVLEEKRRIHAGEVRPDEYDVVLCDLTKQYSNFLAVNRLCLGVKGYECFGLLGVNGAGKTSTFKMMTGDEIITNGNAWIRNFNLKTHMKTAHRLIGYCPQFDALLDDLTGKESLLMYCLMRGVPLHNTKRLIAKLTRDFDLNKHIMKQVKEFSGGNKRKLSSAIALIGDPPVVFLDEPTAGMDPATKRNLWNTLCRLRDEGKCLVLTSHSMEECEALCTRLAIMVNGVFKCLGSTQHLKSKFSEGYMLTVKVKKTDVNVENVNTGEIEQYISSKFPTAVLKETHQELLTYFIPDMTLSWSKMFGIMERGKREIDNLEDYSLGQFNLEQIFLLFTKQQRVVA